MIFFKIYELQRHTQLGINITARLVISVKFLFIYICPRFSVDTHRVRFCFPPLISSGKFNVPNERAFLLLLLLLRGNRVEWYNIVKQSVIDQQFDQQRNSYDSLLLFGLGLEIIHRLSRAQLNYLFGRRSYRIIVATPSAQKNRSVYNLLQLCNVISDNVPRSMQNSKTVCYNFISSLEYHKQDRDYNRKPHGMQPRSPHRKTKQKKNMLSFK